MRSGDKLTHVRDGRSQTHNPLISLPPHVTIKPRFKKYSPHFEHRFETFGNARVLGTGTIMARVGTGGVGAAGAASACGVERARALCARCSRRAASASTAGMEIRFFWRFLRALLRHDRTARHLNAQHPILHVSICSNNFEWFMPLSPNADGGNVTRGPSTHISICSRLRRLSGLDIFRTCVLAFGGGTRLNKGMSVHILWGFP